MKKDANRPANAYIVMSITILICAVVMAGAARTSEGGAPPHASPGVGGARLQQGAPSHHQRTLRKSSWPNEVVKITKLKVKKGPVEFDKKFVADDDWLRGLTLTIQNTSGRHIVSIDASVTLFRKGDEGETDKLPVQFPFSYVTEPEAPGAGPAGRPRTIAPHDSVDVTLSEEGYASLRALLFRENYPPGFSQAEVSIEKVLFSDGVMWYKSFYFQRDPNNPNRWIRDKYFQPGGKFAPEGKPAAANKNGNTRAVGSDRGRASPGCWLSPPGWNTALLFPGLNFDISVSSLSPFIPFGHPTPRPQLPQDCGPTAGTACEREEGCYELDNWEKVPCGPSFPSCYLADDEIEASAPGTGPGRIERRRIACRQDDEKEGPECASSACMCVYVPCPEPTPTPTPTPGGGCFPSAYEGYGGGGGACGLEVPLVCQDGQDNDCDLNVDDNDEGCVCMSPVAVDTAGDGFDLTGGAGGVLFDITAGGRPFRVAWIQGDDAWLALDRNGNGRIDDGAELFGNFTPQPAPPAGQGKNGFLALALFDGRAHGGNADGRIDDGDAVFPSLRLWRDADRDGVSQPSELYALPALDVARIHLDYKESKKADEHGNLFRYRAKVDDAKGAKVNRWAWDVFLVPGP